MNKGKFVWAVVFIGFLFFTSNAFALSERSKVHFEEGVEYVPDAIVVAFSPHILPLDISA